MISHADCEADALKLSELIRSTTGMETDLITEIGPVIGSHAGPGTLAVFFLVGCTLRECHRFQIVCLVFRQRLCYNE